MLVTIYNTIKTGALVTAACFTLFAIVAGAVTLVALALGWEAVVVREAIVTAAALLSAALLLGAFGSQEDMRHPNRRR